MDFSTCSFDDAGFIDQVKKFQPKMNLVYNPTVNTLERMQSEEYMKMFFKLKIVKPNELKFMYKAIFTLFLAFAVMFKVMDIDTRM